MGALAELSAPNNNITKTPIYDRCDQIKHTVNLYMQPCETNSERERNND